MVAYIFQYFKKNLQRELLSRGQLVSRFSIVAVIKGGHFRGGFSYFRSAANFATQISMSTQKIYLRFPVKGI